MPDLVTPTFTSQVSALAVTAAPPAVTATPPAADHTAFHTILSELNPLQYLPIIGTIYRAVTGDTIPEAVRSVGSFVVSGLMGGPIGLITNAALLALEKITGIDPEKIGHNILTSLGVDSHDAGTIAAATPSGASLAEPAFVAWSPSQLTAYGVSTGAGGIMRRGNLEGADVLNDLELGRHANSIA
jgi:hypothetical protein